MRRIIWLIAISILAIASTAPESLGQREPIPSIVETQSAEAASEVLERIDQAATIAREQNKTISVIVEEGVYRSPIPLRIPSHIAVTTASGATRSWRWIYTGPATSDPLVELTGNSYGATIRGLDLRVADPELSDLVGIRVGGQVKNATIENVVFTHKGRDCIGLEIRGHESLTVEKVELRCSVPLVIAGGDNHVFRDLDIGSAVTEEQRIAWHSGRFPATCVWLQGMPNQWTFEGSFTAQGGDHAFYGRVESPKTGQVLRIEGLRYEQSLSNDSEELRAVDLEFTDRALERLVLIGCRWGGNRKKGLKVIGCWDVERVGCFLQGTIWTRKKANR